VGDTFGVQMSIQASRLPLLNSCWLQVFFVQMGLCDDEFQISVHCGRDAVNNFTLSNQGDPGSASQVLPCIIRTAIFPQFIPFLNPKGTGFPVNRTPRARAYANRDSLSPLKSTKCFASASSTVTRILSQPS